MRIFFIALILLIAGVIGAVIWLLRDPDTLRPEIESLIERETGLQVALGGELSWRLWPPVQLVVRDVAADWNDPGAEPLVQAVTLRLDADLWPLLGSDPKLVIHGVAIEGLHARLEQTGETANWLPPGYEGKAPPPIPVPPPTDTPAPPDAWVVDALDLRDSRIDYTEDGETVRVDIAKLAISGIAPERAVPVDASLVATVGDDTIAVDANGTVTFDAAFTRWNLRDVSLEGTSKTLGAPFTAHLDAEVDVTAETFTLPRAELEVAGVSATLTANGNDFLTTPRVSGTIDLPVQNLAQALAPFDVTLDESVGVRGQFEADEKAVRLRDAEVRYADSTIRGEASMTLSDRPRATFDLDVDKFVVPVTEPATPVAVTGGPFPFAAFGAPVATVDPSLDEPLLPLDAVRELDWAGTTRVANLGYDGAEFPNVAIETSNTAGLVKANVKAPSFFGGRADASVTLDARTDQPLWTIAPKLTDVETEPLLAWLDQRLDWAALLLAGSNLELRGNTVRDLLGSVKGKTTFDGGKGKLDISELKRQVQPIALLAGKDDRIARWPDMLNYQKFTGNWAVNGHQHELAMDLDNLALVARGSYDPLADDMDMTLAVTVKTDPALQSFQINPLLMDIALPLHCRGSTEEPKCAADQDGVKRIVASALTGQSNPEVQKRLDEAIEEKVPEEHREAARALLKGFGELLNQSQKPQQKQAPPPQ